MTHARPFEFLGDWSGQVVATAIHAGDDVRPDLAALMVLPADERYRESDPLTDRIARLVPSRVVVHVSRFEVDLNRPREAVVYRSPEEAWGLDVWRDGSLDPAEVEKSLEIYDSFYAELRRRFDRLASRGPFVVLDIHSYNHRRDGDSAPEAPTEENPEVNVGTGSLDRARFGSIVDTFMAELAHATELGRPLDVRENIRFKGGHMARWTHATYPDHGIVLAIEFKKTFMDEWTGEADHDHLDELARAIARMVPVLESAVRAL